MQALIKTKNSLPKTLRDGIFADRKKQFVDRLQWDLCVTPGGHEIDEYDDNFSDYLVIHEGNRHLGSCRVRSPEYSTMLLDHFTESFPAASEFIKMQKGRLFELTRFCRAPDISKDQSKRMMSQIALLMDHYRQEKKLSGFLAVVFPKVARYMDTIGMRHVVLSRSTINNQPVLLVCITQASRDCRFEQAKKLRSQTGQFELIAA